jgi:hypothetical protein
MFFEVYLIFKNTSHRHDTVEIYGHMFGEPHKPVSSMYLWTIFRITFSSSLAVEDKRLIGHKF